MNPSEMTTEDLRATLWNRPGSDAAPACFREFLARCRCCPFGLSKCGNTARDNALCIQCERLEEASR